MSRPAPIHGRFFHASPVRIEKIDLARTVDGGFHLGDEAQARMRGGAWLHVVDVRADRVRRVRDRGGGWAERLRSARSDGIQALVYLNRWEGLPSERILALAEAGRLPSLDLLPDAAFRRLVPEARDSLVLVDADCARLVARISLAETSPSPKVDARPSPSPG